MTLYWKDVNGRNWPACSCLKAWLTAYQAELLRLGVIERGLDIYQLIGNAPASAGVHSQGGCADLAQRSKLALWVSRNMGGAAWGRDDDPNDGQPDMSDHQHLVLKGCPHNDPARYQIGALEDGYNGLGRGGRGGRDDGPRSGVRWPLREWEQGIAWAKARATPPTVIRAAVFNLPDEGTEADPKLPNAPARIAAAIPLVQKQGAPTFIAWNELVGIKGPGNASDHARAVDAELSSTWLLVKPTLSLNENYISYRRDLLEVVRQYDDKVLPSPHGGRHLTRVVFRHKPSAEVFAVGVTHLVHGAGDDRDASRQKQAADAVRYMGNVSKLHNDCPFILLGDMNMHHDLTAAVAAGMKRASRWADDTNGQAKAATYTNYTKTVPSTNPEWAIDQIWFSSHWYVDEWAVLRDLTTAGEYRKPRPSDHDPSVAQARIN